MTRYDKNLILLEHLFSAESSMKRLLHYLVIIIANAFVLYAIVRYFPEFGLQITVPSMLVGYFLVWAVFWLFYSVVWRVISILAWPFKLFTLGLSTVVVNVWIFYLFAFVVNNYLSQSYPWVEVLLGNVWQTFLLSIVLWIVMAIVHFIIKKIV